MSQNWISSSVARMKIPINSSMRLGETCCKCSSSSSIANHQKRPGSHRMTTYLSPAAQLLCSPRQHSSRSTSSTGFPRVVYSLQCKVVWRWHRIQSGRVPGPFAEPASPVTGPRREGTGYTPCMLFQGRVNDFERKEPQSTCEAQGQVILPTVSGWASISCLDRPKEAQ